MKHATSFYELTLLSFGRSVPKDCVSADHRNVEEANLAFVIFLTSAKPRSHYPLIKFTSLPNRIDFILLTG
ncbi:hypothetical protein IV203_015916 [Nitzschia inconspicua]|uniref:Uncharacterized protein n=1 Tax=Nitzschia inconspicua TaxID=303405 RepID=A0A9K3LC27_9STRA|nr:hypothetical protein IV203_015916 [Nitzschia inconspicua]